MSGLVFQWVKRQGGVNKLAQINQRKADKLYDIIDNSELYSNSVVHSARSRMNVVFHLKDESLNEHFLAEAAKHDLVGLKGHRSVGGMRASIYNAMPEAGVDALVTFMKNFESGA